MDPKQPIRSAAGISRVVLNKYIEDLTDEELLRRPGPGCNHLAWQLGHVLASEERLLEALSPGSAAPLPEGFADKHSKETIGSDDASQFCSRAEYQELFEKSHAAFNTALDQLSDADLEKPGPEMMRQFCPTVADLLVLIATHPMMHAGQFVPVRRALDKPVAI